MIQFNIDTNFIMSLITSKIILVPILIPVVLYLYSILFKITRKILNSMLEWDKRKNGVEVSKSAQNGITFTVILVAAFFVLHLLR